MKRELLLFVALVVAAPMIASASGRTEKEAPMQQPAAAPSGSFGIAVVDGLHVTGTPIAVDIEKYRLHVTGLVERPLHLDFSTITAMKAVHRSAELVCPGVFRDEGIWTEIPVRALLDRAGVQGGAASVTFRSIDGSYQQVLPLQKAMGDGVYLAYQFNGKTFDPRNGYPLRLVAEGEPGSVWVKWLGEIEVRR